MCDCVYMCCAYVCVVCMCMHVCYVCAVCTTVLWVCRYTTCVCYCVSCVCMCVCHMSVLHVMWENVCAAYMSCVCMCCVYHMCAHAPHVHTCATGVPRVYFVGTCCVCTCAMCALNVRVHSLHCSLLCQSLSQWISAVTRLGLQGTVCPLLPGYDNALGVPLCGWRCGKLRAVVLGTESHGEMRRCGSMPSSVGNCVSRWSLRNRTGGSLDLCTCALDFCSDLRGSVFVPSKTHVEARSPKSQC